MKAINEVAEELAKAYIAYHHAEISKDKEREDAAFKRLSKIQEELNSAALLRALWFIEYMPAKKDF